MKKILQTCKSPVNLTIDICTEGNHTLFLQILDMQFFIHSVKYLITISKDLQGFGPKVDFLFMGIIALVFGGLSKPEEVAPCYGEDVHNINDWFI